MPFWIERSVAKEMGSGIRKRYRLTQSKIDSLLPARTGGYMFGKTFFAGVLLSGYAFIAAPSFAQSALFDVEPVRAACSTSSEACLLAVQAAISTLRQAGLSEAQLNTQLGVIAGTAFGAAASLPTTERVGLAAVLREIAAASTNTEQIASLGALAARLEADAASVDLTAVAQSFSSN